MMKSACFLIRPVSFSLAGPSSMTSAALVSMSRAFETSTVLTLPVTSVPYSAL